MIQRERERRQQLQAEEEAQHLAKAAQEAAQAALEESERQKFLSEMEVVHKENRRFLEELKIPEYLQAIVDEEQLKGAYVLWHSFSISGLKPCEDCRACVSLVWNIGYTVRHHEVRHGGSDNMRSGGRTWVSWESGERNGYGYKSIDVSASSKANAISISGMRDEIMPPQDFEELRRSYRFQDERLIPDKIRYPDMRPRLVISGTSTVLSDSQLSESEIRQVLASIYLDTKESLASERGRGWPFDRGVPEQERDYTPENISETEKYNVIY